MADGTIRIYAGLMDLLDDGELLFVVGHEMGHMAKEHIRKKIRLAYAASAVRKGIASQGGAAGDVAGSLLGGLAEALLNAQFSQLEEKEADDAGLAFLKRQERATPGTPSRRCGRSPAWAGGTPSSPATRTPICGRSGCRRSWRAGRSRSRRRGAG